MIVVAIGSQNTLRESGTIASTAAAGVSMIGQSAGLSIR
jgi:acyl-[acyl carrier protein]--UDP-N-acetylglucosamine O-acyltransferase